eukprot:4678956-Pleurochrysis_carterae.AAC.3
MEIAVMKKINHPNVVSTEVGCALHALQHNIMLQRFEGVSMRTHLALLMTPYTFLVASHCGLSCPLSYLTSF